MRLRYHAKPDREALEKLRPKVGDVVIYEKARYIVKHVGIRWVRMYPEGGDPNIDCIAMITAVYKPVDMTPVKEKNEDDFSEFEDKK